MQVLAQVHIDYKQQIQDSNPDLAGKKLCLKRPPLNTKDGREARAQRSFWKWQSKQPEVETHQERGHLILGRLLPPWVTREQW